VQPPWRPSNTSIGALALQSAQHDSQSSSLSSHVPSPQHSPQSSAHESQLSSALHWPSPQPAGHALQSS